MSRIPPHRATEHIAALKRAGFYVERTTGGHVIMAKDGLARPIVVPMHPGDLPERVVEKNLKTAGISRKRYLELLGKRKPR